MPYTIPAGSQPEIADKWDVGTIEVGNTGKGASAALIRIKALFGKSTDTPDPNLPPELGVKLFDSFQEVELICGTFGALQVGLTNAINNGHITGTDIDRVIVLLKSCINHFLVGMTLTKEIIDLADLAKVELEEVGIKINWPDKQITR